MTSINQAYEQQDQSGDVESILKVEIENFGPIASGKIELKPLTILMGANNSGKSYASMLIYSIMNSQYRTLEEKSHHIFSKIMQKIKESSTNKIHLEPFDINVEDNTYKNFESEISMNFASPLSDLVRIKEDICALQISCHTMKSKITISNNQMKYPESHGQTIHVVTKDSDGSSNDSSVIDDDKIVMPVTIRNDRSLFRMIHEISSEGYLKNIPYTHYLPASRYGVLQNHKILSAQIMKRDPYAGIEDIRVPQMPGAITGFLASLLEMGHREGSCSLIAKRLEENMLHGTVEIQDKIPTEINYQYLGKTVPLHRASSMVSTLR